MWRSTTFMEIQDLVMNNMPEIQFFDLYNGQEEDYEADVNRGDATNFPVVLLELVGGDWEHDGDVRISREYFFRLHLVLECYHGSGFGNEHQTTTIENLDKISSLANVLDHQSLTYAHNFEYLREVIDTNRTNLIHNQLDFVATVQDCSLQEQNQLQQVVVQNKETVVLVPKSQVIIPAPSFAPAMNGLAAWLRPKVFSPSQWTDQSGNGNHFQQTDSNKQPLLNQNGINGVPSITFDGTTYVELLNKALAIDSITLHIVLKNNGAPSGSYGNPIILSASTFTNPGNQFMQINTIGSSYNANLTIGGLDKNNIAPLDGIPKFITIIKSPVSIEFRLNGVHVATQTAIQNINNLAHYIGSWGGNSWNGEMGDILIYNLAQSGAELEQTETYLQEEYRIGL